MKAYKRVLTLLVNEIKKSNPANGHIKDILAEARFDKTFYGVMKHSQNYEARFAPAHFGQVNNDIVIFGNRLAIVSGKIRIFATVIESAEVAESFRTMHAMAWASAKRP